MDAAKEGKGDDKEDKDKGVWRDLVAYWFLGLCNNYGYVVMLSAAHDIIDQFEADREIVPDEDLTRDCHLMSTGAILLADILPSFTIKLIIPFVPFWIKTRIAVAILLSSCGFLFVAFATGKLMAFTGVIFTSASAGIGESSFLAHMASFDRNVISTWSSGTGGAGVIGAMSYASLRQIGLSPRTTILVMLTVPAWEAVCFFVLLRTPTEEIKITPKIGEYESADEALTTFKEKIYYVKHLLKYMVPLALVYFFEYFINQSLFELVYFTEDVFIDHAAQYRWLQVDYQIGVFISRSSVNLIHVRKVWLMAVFQGFNVVIFLFDAIYFFLPSIWIVFAIVLWEGLLGGGAYVNTFYRMLYEVPPNRRNFAMAMVTQSGSYGIIPAGFLSMPVHNAICRLPAVYR